MLIALTAPVCAHTFVPSLEEFADVSPEMLANLTTPAPMALPTPPAPVTPEPVAVPA